MLRFFCEHHHVTFYKYIMLLLCIRAWRYCICFWLMSSEGNRLRLKYSMPRLMKSKLRCIVWCVHVLFIATLLTRLNIYRSFSHKTIVTYTAKVCATIALILLNLFFLYFIVLRGADKGRSWQWSYAMACIFQLLTDGLLYETLECFWVRELVEPSLSC
jgi:uncharacterized membrane protein